MLVERSRSRSHTRFIDNEKDPKEVYDTTAETERRIIDPKSSSGRLDPSSNAHHKDGVYHAHLAHFGYFGR